MKHEHDYRCGFTCRLPIEGSGTYSTIHQRNPWTLATKSPEVFYAWCGRELEKDCKIKLKPAHKLTGYAPRMDLYNGRGERVGH